jgi:hypothetical protein
MHTDQRQRRREFCRKSWDSETCSPDLGVSSQVGRRHAQPPGGTHQSELHVKTLRIDGCRKEVNLKEESQFKVTAKRTLKDLDEVYMRVDTKSELLTVHGERAYHSVTCHVFARVQVITRRSHFFTRHSQHAYSPLPAVRA